MDALAHREIRSRVLESITRFRGAVDLLLRRRCHAEEYEASVNALKTHQRVLEGMFFFFFKKKREGKSWTCLVLRRQKEKPVPSVPRWSGGSSTAPRREALSWFPSFFF